MTNTTADPFANIPNSDDSLNGEFSPAAPAPKYGILERTEHARQYLSAASIMGLPLPAYVHIGAYDHGDFQSSAVGIQMANASQVKEWAVRFAAVLRDDGTSVMLETGLHDVQVYCGREDNETSDEVPGLAEHTQAACDTITKAACIACELDDDPLTGNLGHTYTHTCDTITKAAPAFREDCGYTAHVFACCDGDLAKGHAFECETTTKAAQ